MAVAAQPGLTVRRALAFAVVGGLLVAAPGASASTTRVGATGAVDYAAAQGEANALRATVSGSTVTLDDDGATIAAGAGCNSVSAHRVTCTPGGVATLSAQLGDGNDAASATGLLPAVIDGGVGDDVLAGGDAPDVLEGGPGDDTLTGGGAGDALFGDGPGLVAGGGADRLTGGAGDDAVDCGDGASDVVVDAETGDVTTGCESQAPSAPPPPPPPPPPPGTATTSTDTAAPPAESSPLDPGVIVALAPVARAAESQAIVPVRLSLRVPGSIRRSALRRTGVRVVVSCSMACRSTARLVQGRRTLTRRTITAGITGRAVRVRATTRANAVTLQVTAPDVRTQTRRIRVTRG